MVQNKHLHGSNQTLKVVQNIHYMVQNKHVRGSKQTFIGFKTNIIWFKTSTYMVQNKQLNC